MPHAIVPAMNPATVCLVTVVECNHASEHDDRVPISAKKAHVLNHQISSVINPRVKGLRNSTRKKPSPTAQPSPTPFGKGPNRTEPARATQPNLKKQGQSAHKHSFRLGWPEDETGAADPLTCSRRTNRYCEADPTPSVPPVTGAHTWWRELTVI